MLGRLADGNDLERLGDLLNDPEVRPYLFWGQETPVDPAWVLERCDVLLYEGGAVIFERKPDGWWAHTAFLPAWRGKHALDCYRHAYAKFREFVSEPLNARIHRGNRGALALAWAVGFIRVGLDGDFRILQLAGGA